MPIRRWALFMVTLVDQNWKPLQDSLEQIDTAVEELILSEEEHGI